MAFEHRVQNTKITNVDEDKRRFVVRAVNYAKLDDYGTKFRPKVFAAGLEKRMPKLMYGHSGWHDITQLLGRGIDATEQRDGLDVQFELDDEEYVKNTRQLWYQLKSGTIDQFSVGFKRVRESLDEKDHSTWIEEAVLGEVSAVVEGAVPGTKLLSMSGRSAGFVTPAQIHERITVSTRSMIDADVAAKIMTQFSLGQLDLADALGQMKEAAQLEEAGESEQEQEGESGSEEDDEGEEGESNSEQEAGSEGSENGDAENGEGESDPELDAILAEVDATLASVKD
jgi:HK97 family phage prohead protease